MDRIERRAAVEAVDGWLIHKAGRGWYRPNAQGYTNNPAEAGRYTHEVALSYSHPNGMDGPRDGMTIRHETEVEGAFGTPKAPARFTREDVEKAAIGMFNLRQGQRGTPNTTFDQCVMLRDDWLALATAALAAIGDVDHG